MAVKPFSKEKLNFFKFSSIVLDEFPKAVRHIFVTFWDSKIALLPGYQVWDDSIAVRNMLLKSEGGKTNIPIYQSIDEWDCTALFQATIYAKTFGSSSGKGPTKTLNDLYLKNKKPAAVRFHPSVNSPTGNQDETYALAIDQIRLLRNTCCHSAKSEIAKADFDQFVQLAKDALTAAKLSTTSIDGIGGLTEDDFPTEKVAKLTELIQKELQSMNRFLQGDMKETTSGIDERTREIKETTSGIDQRTREIKETTSDIDKKLNMICDMHKLMKTSGEPTHTICKDSTPAKMADMLRGMELKKKDSLSNVKVSWKQGAFLGIGGDRSQTYNIVNYETLQGRLVPVYVQDGYDKPDKLVCNWRLQFGIMDNGVFFLVYHDKSQTPYQHRFIQNDMQKKLYAGNEWLKSNTAGIVDLSWVSGDYLCNF